jgi:hypothetical protein
VDLREIELECGLDSSGSVYIPVAGYSEEGNEISDSITCWNFLGWLNNCWLEKLHFRYITTCSPLKVKLVPNYFTLVSGLVYYSTSKMEATYSSETSVDFQRTTWHYILEDRTFITTAVRTSCPTDSFSKMTELHGAG